MFTDTSRSEPARADLAARHRLSNIRANAGVVIEAQACGGETRLTTLAEHGGYRAKFPDVPHRGLEAAIINTGGGVVGGDRISFAAHARCNSQLTISSSTAERVYRSNGDVAEIGVALTADDQSTLAWLPQPAILFSRSRLRRHIEADVATDACLLIAETIVFGRIASGEVMGDGMLHDSWRVRRGGRLVFAEATRLAGALQPTLARPAVASGARCTALLLCVAPKAEDGVAAVRDAVTGLDAVIGVSAWNGQLVLRALAARIDVLQCAFARAIGALRVCNIPAAWSNGHD